MANTPIIHTLVLHSKTNYQIPDQTEQSHTRFQTETAEKSYPLGPYIPICLIYIWSTPPPAPHPEDSIAMMG